MKITSSFTLFFLFVATTCVFAQSNIQNYTPSKLLEKGKIDIKFFNNLYTQTSEESKGTIKDVQRSNYFTTSLEIFTGITESKKINVGIITEYRSNSIGGKEALSVFDFKEESGLSRRSFSHIAPSIKIAPFSTLSNFSFQSSLFIPLHELETVNDVFLAQKSYIWQNRFFYDYTFPSRKFQLFTELGTRLFFGEKGKGYANNSAELAPGAFLSYFPSSKSTVLAFLQHAQLFDLGNNFAQNYTAAGLGVKYQLTRELNIEGIYSKFIRGNDTGLGQSFNLGFRAIL